LAYIDILLIVLLITGGILGYRKGLLMEIVSLIAIVLAITISFKLLHWTMELIQEKVGYFDTLLPFIAFIILFVGILIGVYLLGKSLKKMLDLTPFGLVDSLMGAVIGVLKWALALSVVLWLCTSAEVDIPEQYTKESVLYPYLISFAPTVITWVSGLMPMAHDLVDNVKELFNAHE